MDDQVAKDHRSAILGLTGLVSTAILGVIALCNEMGLVGVLEVRAVDRISDLMLRSIETSGASADLQAQLSEELTKHFVNLRRHLI